VVAIQFLFFALWFLISEWKFRKELRRKQSLWYDRFTEWMAAMKVATPEQRKILTLEENLPSRVWKENQ
jgi:hypothetical protein